MRGNGTAPTGIGSYGRLVHPPVPRVRLMVYAGLAAGRGTAYDATVETRENDEWIIFEDFY